MSVFTSVGIFILAMLIMLCLQLTPSTFLIFYHYACGKTSAKKASDAALTYILGTEVFSAIMFVASYILMTTVEYFKPDFGFGLFPWIMAGIFLAISFFIFFFYYRKSRGTELFISRTLASKISLRAKNIKNRSDAFLLGTFIGIVELPFTLPVYIITAFVATQISAPTRPILIILTILASIFPLFIYLKMFNSGHNLATIEKSRIKNKPFFRLMLTVGFLMLVFATINIGISH